MIESEYIELIVSPKGEVKIEAFGFKGGGCLKVTQEIIDKIGTTKKQVLKNEYHDQKKVFEAVKVKT